jgi:hypothetical protein
VNHPAERRGSNVRRARLLAVTVLLTLPFAALTRAPYTAPGADTAVLRFSWRMSVSADERCRVRTPAELEALPAHMRTPQVCEREEASYVLITRIDDAPGDTLQLVRGGVKGDRPLFVLRERPLPAGRHRVRVAIERQDASGSAVTLGALDTTLVLETGRVRLVTLDAEGRLHVR